MDFNSDVLVLGDGPCARQVAGDLAARGMTTRLDGGRVIGCSGHAGAFQATLVHDGRRVTCRAGSIVVAGGQVRTPNFAAYGLNPSGRVWSASDLARAMEGDDPAAIMDSDARVVFLNGWRHETHPVAAAGMLRLCLRMQQHGSLHTVFMTGNLKVTVEGMEACCQAAKAAGTVFIKVAEPLFPVLETLDDGRVGIDYWDASAGMEFRLLADYVIVDERIGPDPALIQLADVLRLARDPFGFVQSDNVRRLGSETNRRGIFAAGAARAVLAAEEERADAGHLALKVEAFLSGLDGDPRPGVEIDQGRCARCLTCYRLCPHAAIDIAPRMMVIAEACQGCGVCVAGCPNRAIRIESPHLETALQMGLAQEADGHSGGAFVPRIAAFCCRRSAVAARELAVSMGLPLPAGLLAVEGLCGGTFSTLHLLNAFDAQVDGVMVITCHPGNCHSEQGTRHAEKRTAEAAKALAMAGVEGARIRFHTLAANQGSEFARRVNAFEREIAALGPFSG